MLPGIKTSKLKQVLALECKTMEMMNGSGESMKLEESKRGGRERNTEERKQREMQDKSEGEL